MQNYWRTNFIIVLTFFCSRNQKDYYFGIQGLRKTMKEPLESKKKKWEVDVEACNN